MNCTYTDRSIMTRAIDVGRKLGSAIEFGHVESAIRYLGELAPLLLNERIERRKRADFAKSMKRRARA